MAISTQVQLASRPTGWPEPSDFRTIREELPALASGEVRVSNEFISVDPYMRGRMNDAKSYVPPFALDETMEGGAVGRVTESASDTLSTGDLVLHSFGWRDVAQGPADAFRKVEPLEGLPSSVYLGALGMTGLTAYAGLTRIADMKENDVVFVSGAAGAVGSTAGQMARLLGAKQVIGSAGSPEKVSLLTGKYGFTDAFNYKDAPVRKQLAEVAPDGIDVYFDNVGGDHLEAAIDVFNTHGRAALCGAISQYNETEKSPGPDNMFQLVGKNLTLRGFIVRWHEDLQPEFVERMTGWLRSGDVVFEETVVEGVDNSVQAFLDMMAGANTGKMVVKI